MPQAVLGVAFSFGIPMAFAAVQGECRLALAAGAGQPVLGAGLRHRIRHGGPRRRPEDRHEDLGHHLGSLDVPAIMLFYAVYLGYLGWALAPWWRL
jgi:4-hydroxybenzoate polyprenyltransferase